MGYQDYQKPKFSTSKFTNKERSSLELLTLTSSNFNILWYKTIYSTSFESLNSDKDITGAQGHGSTLT